jgi:hypothetical protein
MNQRSSCHSYGEVRIPKLKVNARNFESLRKQKRNYQIFRSCKKPFICLNI